jgi:hypothetical protein
MKKRIVLAASRLFPERSPMKITRRFAVASLLVIAVAVVLGAPAPASAGKYKGTQATLYPAADSTSPRAIGKLTLLDPVGSPLTYYRGLTVSVTKLAPNAAYYMPVTVVNRWTGWTSGVNVWIQTDAHGKGERGWGDTDYLITSHSFQVYDASGTLVLTSNP